MTSNKDPAIDAFRLLYGIVVAELKTNILFWDIS
jgi:hypothetical protein